MKAYLRFVVLTAVILLAAFASASGKFPLTKAFSVMPWQYGDQPGWTDVVVDGHNRVHLLFSKSPAGSNNVGHLYYRCYDSSGAPLENFLDLVPTGFSCKIPLGLACNSSGKVAAACMVEDTTTGELHRWLWMSDSAGTFQQPVEFGGDQSTLSIGIRPGLAVSESGKTIIAWEDYQINQGDSIYYKMYDVSNQQMFATRSATTAQRQYKEARLAKVAVAPSGQFVIVWQAHHYDDWPFFQSQPHARVFDSEGNPVSDEIYPACEGYPETCAGDSAYFYQSQASGMNCDVAIQENGDFAISYQRDNAYDCTQEYYFVRSFSADGTPQGPNVSIND